MNKIIFLLIITGIFNSQAMQEAASEQVQGLSWQNLPEEVQLNIVHQVQANTLAETIRNIYALSMVNQDLRRIVNAPETINLIARNYIHNHPERAKTEFIELVRSLKEPNYSEATSAFAKLKLVNAFLDAGIDLNSNYLIDPYNEIIKNAEVNTKTTPLFEAIESRNEALVKLLIKYGADVNAIDDRRGTPLARAISLWNQFNEYYEEWHYLKNIIKLLLNAKADLHLRSDYTYSAIELAQSSPYRNKILKFIAQNFDAN